MGAITSNDEKKLQQAFKTQARNNKLHNKQAENQPINSRTINVKRNNEQSTKIKITAVIKIAVKGASSESRKNQQQTKIIREIPAAKIVKERAKAAIKTVLTITTNQTITIAANLIIITVIVIIKR